MKKKIFSEAEVSTILKKAVEIQEKDQSTGYASGITIDELERIARECGISDDALQAALVQPEEDSKSSFLNLVETHERVFEGELDFSRMDEVIDALGDKVRIQTVQHFGRTLKAQVMSGTVFGTLELTARNGRTKLKFRQTPFVAYFAGLHAPLILSVVAMASFGAQKQIAIGLAVMLCLLALGLTLFATIAGAGKKKARAFVEKLSNGVGSIISEHQTALNAPDIKVSPQTEELSQRLNG